MNADMRKMDLKVKIVALGLVLGVAFLYLNPFWSTTGRVLAEDEFPSEIAEWIGSEVAYDERVLEGLESDRIIYRRYDGNEGARVTLFVAYYDTLEKTDSSHSPIVCFTGQGWTIEASRKAVIPVALQERQRVTVNEILLEKQGQYILTFYWYQAGSRVFTNRGAEKLVLFFRKVLGKAENNAFVRVTVSFSDSELKERKRHEMSRFVGGLYPEMKRLMP